MNKNILQQFFDGEIFPAENINPNKTNPKSYKINRAISNEKEYFYKILSKTDIERFDKLNELHYKSSGMYSYECFSYGFKLGAALLIEILHDINS